MKSAEIKSTLQQSETGYLAALTYPSRRKNWLQNAWLLHLIGLLPLWNGVYKDGWMLHFIRNMVMRESDFTPQIRCAGQHFADGLIVRINAIVFYLPALLAGAVLVSSNLKTTLKIIYILLEYVLSSRKSLLDGIVDLLSIDVILIPVLAFLYFLFIWPILRAGLIRYAITGDASVIYDYKTNLQLFRLNFFSFVKTYIYLFVTRLSFYAIYFLISITGIGLVVLPFLYVFIMNPMHTWIGGHLVGQLAQKIYRSRPKGASRVFAETTLSIPDAITFPFKRAQNQNDLAWIAALQVIPCVGSYVTLTGWGMELFRRIVDREKDVIPPMDRIGAIFGISFVMMLIFSLAWIPYFLLAALLGYEYIEEVIEIAKFLLQLFFDRSETSAAVSVTIMDVALFFLRSIGLVVYPLCLYLFMQVIKTRYALERRLSVFFQPIRNFRILAHNLDKVLLLLFFNIIGLQVLSTLSSVVGATGIGVLVVLLFFFPAMAWMDAFFRTEFGIALQENPDPKINVKPFISASVFALISILVVAGAGILVQL
ncbi:MAG: DUF4013 domain-containing protein [Leptospiraceae bacterium]|nr:DUF4013 domain-containing protein [Leptospiraceae bacterium]